MAREIGYFYYVARNKIDMFGSGNFSGTKDTGYVYGWTNEEDDWILRAYLVTFEPNTTNAKAGLMIRETANDNVRFSGLMLDGNGYLKTYRRKKTNGTITVGTVPTPTPPDTSYRWSTTADNACSIGVQLGTVTLSGGSTLCTATSITSNNLFTAPTGVTLYVSQGGQYRSGTKTSSDTITFSSSCTTCTTSPVVYPTDSAVNLGITQGLWLMIQKIGETFYYRYSLDSIITDPNDIEWLTLASSNYDTEGLPSYERELCVCSGDDFVNYAYFTQVFTDNCWISPIGQKED